jgi:phosphate:Na+ symporter
VPDIKSNPDMVSFVAEFTDLGYFSYLLFVLIGAILTVVIQSSSATMALTLVMTSQGWITFEIAAAMVLGENIGTTITAELASLAANVYAKRSAKIHTLFNVIGVSWMLLVFPFFLKGIAWLNGFDSALALDEKPEAIPIALSTFHTLFNLINVLILINFVPQLVNLATVVVKSKGKEDEEFRLEYIKSNMNMVSPQVSGLEARQEITRMALHVTKMMGQLENLMSEKDEVKRERIYKKLQKYEEISDKLSEAISDFLSKTSKMAQSNQASYDFMMMLGIAHDLENMADIFVSMGGAIMGKNKRKIWFSPDQRVQLDELLGLVRKALETMNTNLAKWDISPEDLEAAVKIEAQIDRMRKRLRKNYLSKIEEGEYNVRGGILYAELFNSSERLADYIENISQGLAGNL